MAQRLPREQLDQIVADYQAGMGSTTLARAHGLSENGVLRHLQRSGVTIRLATKPSAADIEEIQQLRADGWTQRAIADRFGVTPQAISMRLRGSSASLGESAVAQAPQTGVKRRLERRNGD